MKFRLRNNALLLASLVVYLATIVVVAFTIDLQYYQKAKSDLMSRLNLSVQTDDNWSTYDKMGRRFLTEKNPAALEKTETDLLSLIDSQMAQSITEKRPIVRIDITTTNGDLRLKREIEDRRRFNTFRNSLFDRDYTKKIAKLLFQGKTLIGYVNFYYCTPLADPDILELTRRYWFTLIGLLTAITTGYVGVLLKLVLPIKKVTEAIQESQGKVTRFIKRPHSSLERLYNTLARDALLTAVSTGLQTPKSRHLRMTLEELIEFLIPRITDWFAFDKAWVLDVVWEGPERVAPVRQLPIEKDDALSAWNRIAEAFEGALVRNLHGSWASKMPQIFHRSLSDGKRHLFVGVLPDGETEARMRILVLLVDRPLDNRQLDWRKGTSDRVYRQIIALVEHQSVQSRELFREKSEANVNLSRNLGHDLTNIIATSKLELMTVRQLLRGDPSTWFDSKEKVEVMKGSLTRLLDNTRSLQQIVNLYRAYEYLKSPRYESIDLRELFQEVIGIFRLSMSAALDISCDSTPDLPRVEVEPRLLKLALFNLFTNAQDAIRCLPAEEQASGRIIAHAALDADRNRVVVRLSDTGPGIRTPDGRLVREGEIARIFELGYSTKSSGEGLGLNWVRTILTEFHSGHLVAYNRPEGGATFEFSLEPSRAPDEKKPSASDAVRLASGS